MTKNLPALTSLRFFAAAMIVIQHTSSHFKIGTQMASELILIQGVSFFFVLSGFVLTYSHPTLPTISSGFQFIWARIARVWPAHLVTMAIYSYCFVYWQEMSQGVNIANIFLLQAWYPYRLYFFSFNGVAWSLSVEMFFYVMFPLLIMGWNKSWWWKLAGAIALTILAIQMPVIYGLKSYSGLEGPMTMTAASFTYIWPPAHLLEFVLGMIAAMAFKNMAPRLERLSYLASSLLEVGALAVSLYALWKIPVVAAQLAAAGTISNSASGWWTVSGAAPATALLLFVLARDQGIISRALSVPALVLAGEVSFSIYLIHQMLLHALEINPAVTSGNLKFDYLVYWGVLLGLSYAMWRYVEKPSQRFMKGLISPVRQVKV